MVEGLRDRVLERPASDRRAGRQVAVRDTDVITLVVTWAYL